MIDVTKPLQLANGAPVEFVGTSYHGDYIIRLLDGAIRYFSPESCRHVFGDLPDLQNVPDEAQAADKRVRDAAHDLLAALKDMLAMRDAHLAGHIHPKGEFVIVANAQAAIARAEGGAA